MSLTFEEKQNLEFNDRFAVGFDRLENTTENIFITGQAGTGKSTLLQYFRGHSTKSLVVLAPTGAAAVNVGGQTIHSFFAFKPDITPETVTKIRLRKNQIKLYKALDCLVIDEISMVRADLLDCMDAFLRIYGPDMNKPFGGVQLIAFGDLYQLPPVLTRTDAKIFREHYASPYFFDAKCFPSLNLKIIELKKIYRQKEKTFIELLGKIRHRTVTDADMALLNQRYDTGHQFDPDEFILHLTTTNAMADRINQAQMARLESTSAVSEGEVLGDFEQKFLPTQYLLELKEGAQVMLLNNDSQGRWINGTIGHIRALPQEPGLDPVEVELENGVMVEVYPFTWEMYKFFFNEDTAAVESEEVGAFRQYPIRLAWAVTIHKAQGKTFERVIIDIGAGTFSHGQAYVALSRCRSLEGMFLRRPVAKRHILLDTRVVNFMKQAETDERNVCG